MTTTSMSLEAIRDLAHAALAAAGADAANAGAIANTVMTAERDGSHSHGLFRVPGYVASLRSGKVNGAADPRPERRTPVLLHCDGDMGYAPLALARCYEPLAEAAEANGLAILALTRSFHFAALWPEVEALAERGLAALSGVSYKPVVAPAGGREPLFGTNPLAFAWPRPGGSPVVFDMATAARAMGDVQIAARDGQPVPLGTGLDAEGNETTDPAEILKGVLLPFGGYKGSAIALMVELLAGPLVGENFSYEAAKADNNDGGPARGGQFLLALSPERISGGDWAERSEAFFAHMGGMAGVRLPGERRHRNRDDAGPRAINAELVARIEALTAGET